MGVFFENADGELIYFEILRFCIKLFNILENSN